VTSFIVARSIARLFGFEISPNGQVRRENRGLATFGGVDGKLGGNIEVDGKRFKIEGEIDGKANGAAWKKEVGEVNTDGGFVKEDGLVDQAPARVQTPGGS
jgi:hypothetical protein